MRLTERGASADGDVAEDRSEEVEGLRELLEQREKQLLQMSHKLEVREAMTEMNGREARRDSLLDRISKPSSYGSSLGASLI